MKSRKITVVIGIGGKIADRIEWTVRSASGESLARLTIDELIGYAKAEAKYQDLSFDMLVSTEDQTLHLTGTPNDDVIDVYINGERQKPVSGYIDRLDLVLGFIGYKVQKGEQE